MLTNRPHALPRVVADHIAACNSHDARALMSTFIADAFVNDAGREFSDPDAISDWVETEIVAPKVTMDVIDTIVRRNIVIVRAKIDGEYDKAGLPDPLILTYHFSLADEGISQLIITLNRPDQ